MDKHAAQHILVHAGFHKAGSTSLQAMLRRNRAVLADHAAIWTPKELRPYILPARAYAKAPSAEAAATYRAKARQLAERVSHTARSKIVLSSEDFLGKMPGDGAERNYAAGPDLAAILVAALREAMPNARIDLLLITRETASWMRSLYWQLVQHGEEARAEPDFLAAMIPHPDLGAVAQEIGRAARADAAMILALEELTAQPLGPVQAVIDWLDLPASTRDAMIVERQAPSNTRPKDAIVEVFRALNQSRLHPAEKRLRRLRLNKWLSETRRAPQAAAPAPRFNGPRVFVHLGADDKGGEVFRQHLRAAPQSTDPDVCLATAAQFGRAIGLAKWHRRVPIPWLVRAHRRAIRRAFERLPTRPLTVISCPELVGPVPSKALLANLKTVIEQRFGADGDIYHLLLAPGSNAAKASEASLQKALGNWPLFRVEFDAAKPDDAPQLRHLPHQVFAKLRSTD